MKNRLFTLAFAILSCSAAFAQTQQIQIEFENTSTLNYFFWGDFDNTERTLLETNSDLFLKRKDLADDFLRNVNPLNNNSNLRVDTLSQSALAQAVSNVLFGGCVNISNLTITAPGYSLGYFVDSLNALGGLDSGLVMTTGTVLNAVGPNNSASASEYLNANGDSLLTSVCGWTTYDACVIEFDFTPLADTIIGCEFVFASEEYPEFVNSNFNDIFGFYISGPNPAGGNYNLQNIAIVPGTSDPIAINSVNAGMNANYYVDNTNGVVWQYDGMTTPIALNAPVVPGQLYHFKIAIADAGDGAFDSAVFLKGGSFLGNQPLPVAKFGFTDIGGNTVQFTNQSGGTKFYNWDFGDGSTSTLENPTHTYAQPGVYNVKLNGSNYCYVNDTTQTISVSSPTGLNEQLNQAGIFIADKGNGIFELGMNAINGTKVNLTIMNYAGQVLQQNSHVVNGFFKHEINLENLAQGVYLLRLDDGKNNHVIKLLKNN